MTKDLTKGTPWKVIALFSVPVLIGNIFQQLYNLVDTVIVGNTLGFHALGAVGSTGALSFLVLGFCNGLTAGFAVPVARCFGAKDYDKMRHYVGLAVTWCTVISVIVTALAASGARGLLHLMQTPDTLFDDAYHYIFLIFLGIPCTILYNMASGILRAVGDSKTPLYFLIFASIINAGIDFFFIAILHMGVQGAAFATVLSQGMAGLLCVIYILKKFPILHISRKDLKINKDMTLDMFGIGFPMAFQFSVTAVGAVILQRTVNDFGAETVSAYAAANKVENLMVQSFQTLGTAMATYCAQNLGAKNYRRIRSGVRSAFLMTLLCAGFSALLNLAAGPALIRLFVNEISPEAMRAARVYLLFMAAGYGGFALLFLYRNVLQGLGKSLFPFLGGALEFVLRLFLCIFALQVSWNDWSRYLVVCFASPSAWVLAAAFLFVRYRFYDRGLRELAARQELAE